MSWSFTVCAKPTEVPAKVARALSGVRGQSDHAALFDAIEDAIGEAVHHVADATSSAYGRSERTVLVESSGHVSADGAQCTLSIRTLTDYFPPDPASAA